MKEEAAEVIINGHSKVIAFSISAAIAAWALVFAAGKWSGGMDRDLLEVQKSISDLRIEVKELNKGLSASTGWRAETTAMLTSQMLIIQSIQRQQEANTDAIQEIRSQEISGKKSNPRILP